MSSFVALTTPMLTAIIVAGGSSQRMGFDKLFALLGDQPVVAHSIATFEQTASVGEIILVGRAERLTELEALVRARGFRKVQPSSLAGDGDRTPVTLVWNGSLRRRILSRCTTPPGRSLGRN